MVIWLIVVRVGRVQRSSLVLVLAGVKFENSVFVADDVELTDHLVMLDQAFSIHTYR